MCHSSHLIPGFGRTNILLSGEEAGSVRQHLRALEAELNGIEHELAILLVKRARTIDCMKKCKIALAPHKKLPPEILSRIFVFSVKLGFWFDIEWSDPNSRAVCRARTISQVCSAWRMIAFSTSQLWKLLFCGVKTNRILASELPPRTCARQKSLPLDWVPQSGLVLKLSDRGALSAMPYAPERIQHAINHCLIANSHRIRHLGISVPYQYIHQIFNQPPNSFSELETLTVVQSSCGHGEKVPSTKVLTERPGSSFVVAHYLRAAAFWYMDDIGLRRLKLPWAQLTDLALVGNKYQIVTDVCLMVLSNCTLLVRCHFSPISFSDEAITPDLTTLPYLPVTSQTLQKLVLDFAEVGTEIAVFLRSLVLPNLRRLGLSRTNGPLWVASDYIAFLQPVSSTLKTFQMLDVPNFRQPARDISGLLASMPNATCVTLPTDCFLSATTMKKIACGDLLPRMEYFTFGARRLSPALNMLKSRQALSIPNDGNAGPISRFKLIRIFASFEFDDEQRYMELHAKINAMLTAQQPKVDVGEH